MIANSASLERLIKALQQIPHLASKNIYRVVDYFLEQDLSKIEQLCRAILDARQKIERCSTCFFWQEQGAACGYCSSGLRDKSLVCVVENWQDLIVLERVGVYKGVYHILGGVICPLEGIGPDNLTIAVLLERIEQERPAEVILALNQTPEGEATAAFIARGLQRYESIVVSRLARGVPVGAFLETMDRVTLCKALFERRPF